MEPFTGWPPAALEWFEELEHNNNRDWFHAHRTTYDNDVRGPLESLLEEVREEFGDAKVFRPNRDTRFSADKTPYKTTIYAALAHPDGGGWYVRLSKDGIFTGGGLYSPDRERLNQVRAAIAADDTGKGLEAVVQQMAAQRVALMTEGGLKTAPRGYPVDHPRIAYLRLQHLIAGTSLEPGPWLHTPEAIQKVTEAWRAIVPLLEWLPKYA